MNFAAMRYVAERCQVEGAGRALLWAIAWHANRETGDCYAGERTLARTAGVSRSTVSLWLPKLFEGGETALIVESSGRRARTWRIVAHLDDTASGPTAGPQGDRAVVDRSDGGSGPISDPVVDRSAGPPIGGREELEDLKDADAVAVAASGSGVRSTDPSDGKPEWHRVETAMPCHKCGGLTKLVDPDGHVTHLACSPLLHKPLPQGARP